ncbi:MAG: hypothetical protein AB1333_01455 [Patescibacteria group bacterium]
MDAFRDISAVFVAGCYLFACVFYSFFVHRKKVTPKLATWIIFSVATGIGVATFVSKNIKALHWQVMTLQASDFFSCVVITVILFLYKYHIRLTKFDRWCLVASGVILILWWISKDAQFSNFLVQALICVGYAPTVIDIFREKKHNESFVLWGSYFIASVVSFVPVLFFGELISIVYSTRSTLMLLGMIFLLIKFKNKE